MAKTDLVRIQVQVTEAQYARLKKQAYKEGKSLAQIIREVLEQYQKGN